MANIKEAIEREIRGYERDREIIEKEAIKQKTKVECFNEFIACLRDFLAEIEKEEQED